MMIKKVNFRRRGISDEMLQGQVDASVKKRGIWKKASVAGALAAVMLIGGVSAYFTAEDYAPNSWTVGNVDIEIQEPLYDQATDQRTNITPNMVLDKDPQIANIGSNDAYVFMMVSIPKATVMVASEDGKSASRLKQELFEYAIDQSWTLIDTHEGSAENTYVFAYGSKSSCTALKPGEKTSVLFKGSEIKFKNIIEGQGLENTTLDIPVQTWAIQTDDLTEFDTSIPEDVWQILMDQKDSTFVSY